MKLEEILPKMRKRGKFTHDGIKPNYVTITLNEWTTPYDSVVLVSEYNRIIQINYPFDNKDTMADWIDCEPIVPVKMYAHSYDVRCPNCNKPYSIGSSWETRVGDTVKCTCGHQLLLFPPVDSETKPESKDTGYEWPKA
jgi:DNA-directed RNA polymerase subunit RPC12/RpoP